MCRRAILRPLPFHVCPECGSGRQPANGQLIAVAPEIVEMAQCDAQRVPTIETEALAPTASDERVHVGAR